MDVREAFEIQQTASYIVTRGFSRVCLQFPDSLLPHAVSVHDALRAECAALISSEHHGAYNGDCETEPLPEAPPVTNPEANVDSRQEIASLRTSDLPGSNQRGKKEHGSGFPGFTEGEGGKESEEAGVAESEAHLRPPQFAARQSAGHAADPPHRDVPHFYVLADAATATCSSCCVDEVSPCHVSAECIVHYGHACMSRRPARFPVRLDPTHLPAAAPAVPEAAAAAAATDSSSSNTAPLFHPVDHSRLLRRRYFLVEKTKDASIIGIVVISQSAGAAAASTRATVAAIRTAAVAAGKKAYVIVIRRRITPEKLANFPECDVLVLVACAEGVILDGMGQGSSGGSGSSSGSRAFYAPVVTPFEALMALEEGREWTGEYRMLLDGAGVGGGGRGGAVRKGEAGSGEGTGEGGEDAAPRFSFVKGSLVSPAPHKPSSAAPSAATTAAESNQSALAVRQDMALSTLPVSSDSLALAQASGQSGYATSAAVEARSGSEFLALRRDYKGLEVPWFMAPGGTPREGGGDARGRGDEGGREDGGAVGAFMPNVAPAIDAVRVVEGREGRAAGYVDEPLQG
ncbi:unnamed protein product [Closterium sp. Naga37s-1]|nr:unnamed protein product [Closterium sp. Naga37s-1]